MKDQPRNAESLIRATSIERQAMLEFFRNIGIIEPELFGTSAETNFCSILLHSWLVIESIFFTRLHSGQDKMQLYYPDESYLKLNEDNLINYYKSNHSIKDPELVARFEHFSWLLIFPIFRSSHMLLKNVLKSASLLENLKLDEHEIGALFVLLLLRNGLFSGVWLLIVQILVVKRIGASKKAQEWIDYTFKQLSYYYRNTYSDFANRLADLILCLESIEETDHFLDQLALIVQLQYKDTSLGYKLYVRGNVKN